MNGPPMLPRVDWIGVLGASLLVTGAILVLLGVSASRHAAAARPAAPGGTPIPYLDEVGQCVALAPGGSSCRLRYVPIEGQACLVGLDPRGVAVAVDCWPR